MSTPAATDVSLPTLPVLPCSSVEASLSSTQDKPYDASLPIVRNAASSSDMFPPAPPPPSKETSPDISVEVTQATPRSQLKRSSPESHVPVTPSKRRSSNSDSIVST